MTNFKEGDFVICDTLKTSPSMPYIIEIKEVSEYVISYYHKGEMNYIAVFFVRKADLIDRIFGYLFDKLIK